MTTQTERLSGDEVVSGANLWNQTISFSRLFGTVDVNISDIHNAGITVVEVEQSPHSELDSTPPTLLLSRDGKEPVTLEAGAHDVCLSSNDVLHIRDVPKPNEPLSELVIRHVSFHDSH